MAEQPEDIGRESRQIQRRGAQQFMHGGSTKLPTIVPERIGYLPEVEQKFGVDRAQWRALIDAVWPSATTVEGVLLALSYCKARGLDPFKRPVHVVPVWSSTLKRMVETVWPGIGELRTTAHRTRQYAGKSRAVFGPMITSTFKNDDGLELKLAHPEWCQMTVSKLVGGKARTFEGEQVWWLETYARESRFSDWPNSMWRKRVNGQIAKCAEAAALRGAFPEEIGNEYIDDEIGPEMQGITPEIAVGRQQEPEIQPPAGNGWGRQYTIAPEVSASTEGPSSAESAGDTSPEDAGAEGRDGEEDAGGKGKRSRRPDPVYMEQEIARATNAEALDKVFESGPAKRLRENHPTVYGGLVAQGRAKRATFNQPQAQGSEPQQDYDPDTGEVPAGDDGTDHGGEPPLRSGGRVVYMLNNVRGAALSEHEDAEAFVDALERAHEDALGFDKPRLLDANTATIGMLVLDVPSLRRRCEALGWRDRG